MSYTEKGTVEDFIIQELQRLGWTYFERIVVEDRRKKNFEESLVIEDLKESVRKINPDLDFTDGDLDFVTISLKTVPATLDGIKRFLFLLRNGLVIPLQKEGKERTVRLVDFENQKNNEFTVTRQFRVEGLRGNIRADIILLVNGIPLVLIECKNPTIEEVTWLDAYKDIKIYEEKAPDLFKYVQFSIATDGTKTYHFPNGFNEEDKDFLSIWKDPYPFEKDEFKGDTLKTTIYGLLSKQNLLDVIENFTFIRTERDRVTKIMARYMQYRATNRIFQRVVKTLKEEKEQKKFGLIWHWQGSGKTYTMAFSAWKLFQCPESERPSIFVIVDRKDLEEQIEKDFAFLEIPMERVESIRQLIEFLRWGKEGKRGIFLVTIEKFSPKEFLQLRKEGKKIEIKRENVIVLADEVHRTQYGKFSIMMRSIFKNAFIFGFTGTPLQKIERNTFQKFCPKGEFYRDRYSMMDALDDKVTVPLSYQARLQKHHLNEKQLRDFRKFEETELKKLSKEEQKELKKKIRVNRAYLKKPSRIEEIAEDLAEHFKDVVETTELKAMVVTVDREACVLYKNAIDRFLPPNSSEIVMTFGSKEKKKTIRNYYYSLQDKYGTTDLKEIHQKVIENFKTKKDPKILIVTDMLITGFDAPNLWTMYLDKPLKEHRILQAIARTNRPFENKKFGFIVDYIGVLKELENAFQKYEARDAKDLRIVIRDLEKEKQIFVKLLSKALRFFEKVKIEDTYESMERVLDQLIEPEKARDFENTMKELMKSYEMLQGDPFLLDYLADYRILAKIYVVYYKRFKKIKVDELKIERLSKKTIRLIQETIGIGEIEKQYPTVTVDEKYMQFLKRSIPKTRGGAIDVITTTGREARSHPSSPFFINLSREIERTYEEFRTRKIETEEAMRRVLSFIQKIVRWKQEEKEIGADKYPIYEAIKSVLPDLEKQVTFDFTNNLLAHLKNRKLVFRGWQQQRDIRRKVRAEIMLRLLSKFKDEKDKIDDLLDATFEALEEVQ